MTNNVSVTYTENGAKTLDKSGSKVLDFYSKGGALRTRSKTDILKIFVSAFDEDPLLALKTLFYLRDVRGGQGERNVARVALNWVAENKPLSFAKNFDNIVKFGRWDDLFVAFDTKVEAAMVKYVKTQLATDKKTKLGNSISLAAKWMPSANTSSKDTRALAHRFIKAFRLTPSKYRKTLSELRARINVIESAMSNNEWEDIDYECVPSKANLNYKKAFSRHDGDRYTKFIQAVQSGTKKMNASTLYPYEVVRSLRGYSSVDSTLDALWDSLPDYLKSNPHNGLVLPDVSGSMMGLPLQVSVSLAIYFAQRSKGYFANHYLEFSSKAVLRRLVAKKISEAWPEVCRSTNWCGSTNLQSAFDAILKAAVKNNVPQEELPDVLYIISDMEWNVACESNSKTNFETAKAKFEAAGYKLPVVCFWNVDARSDQSPVKRDEMGTILVSGCSPSIFSQVVSGVTVTPYDYMLQTLEKERYSSVVV
jgi:hypothetical protein